MTASDTDLIEELSALEHEQWMTWSKTVFKRMYDMLMDEGKTGHEIVASMEIRWEPNWIPYGDLDEETKEYDREWAEKALAIVRKYIA